MARHLLNETAEFALPTGGRHARPDDDQVLEPTLRFDAGFRAAQPKPDLRPNARAR